MKIIHLSDTHVDPEILYKIDSQQRFRQALDHIKDNHTCLLYTSPSPRD